MQRFTVQRTSQDSYATFGVMTDARGMKIGVTVERPWKDNQNGVSCIPAGLYQCSLYASPKHNGLVVPLLANVPDREAIEIHPANWPSQLLGCIAVGAAVDIIEGQKGVTDSQATFKWFMQRVANQPFELLVVDPPLAAAA